MPIVISNDVIYSPTSSIEYSDEEKKKPFRAIQISKDRRLEVPITYPYVYDHTKPVKIPTIVKYLDVNSDKNLRKKMVYKFSNHLEEWITDEKKYLKLLEYFKLKDGKVLMTKKNKKSHSKSDKVKIKKYILDKIIDKKDIKNILKKYIKVNKINWYDLHKHENNLKSYFLDKLIGYLKNNH